MQIVGGLERQVHRADRFQQCHVVLAFPQNAMNTVWNIPHDHRVAYGSAPPGDPGLLLSLTPAYSRASIA
jgi:hypothetical protein